MSTSEARILANQANSLKSSGPKTPEGKERSRANSFQHGLTGGGIVLPVEDAAEVDRLTSSLMIELRPSGDMGRLLVRRIAMLAVRMERGVTQENATIADRVREARANLEVPEGLDDQEARRLRIEAGERALFDPSQEATLARRYEAATERGFFRALKELRQVEKAAMAEADVPPVGSALSALGSFLPVETLNALMATLPPKADSWTPPKPGSRPATPSEVALTMPVGGSYEVPFSIGRPR